MLCCSRSKKETSEKGRESIRHCVVFVKLYKRFVEVKNLRRTKYITCTEKCCYTFYQAMHHQTEKSTTTATTTTKKKNRHQKETLNTS